MFRCSPYSRLFSVCKLNRSPKGVIYLAQMSMKWLLSNTPGKLPINHCNTQLLLGRSCPVCSLRGINHSAGLYPRFFFQDAFGISCEINCHAGHWSTSEGLLTAPQAVSGGEVYFIPGHWALVSYSSRWHLTPCCTILLLQGSFSQLPCFPLKTVVTVVCFNSTNGDKQVNTGCIQRLSSFAVADLPQTCISSLLKKFLWTWTFETGSDPCSAQATSSEIGGM